MNRQQIERRQGERRADDEELPPEYLAVLEACGGEIRAADRTSLANRRRDGSAGSGPDAPLAGKEAEAEATPADRRARP